MEGGSEVVKIVAAKVEDYRTGTITYNVFYFTFHDYCVTSPLHL